jgi:hypothetical protein
MSVGSQHLSSSAKTGAGVNEIFRTLAEKIIEYKKNQKDAAPKMKQNTRGRLNIGGMTDFNPDANVRLSRAGDAKQVAAIEKKKQEKKGCCGGGGG